MRNIRSLKVIPQILLLSIFALSSCGNQTPSNDACLKKLKENLEKYRTALPTRATSERSEARIDDTTWQSVRTSVNTKFLTPDNKLENISECKSPSDGKEITKNTEKYEKIYSDLEIYDKLTSNYDEDGEKAKTLKSELNLDNSDVSNKKITNHKRFVDFAVSAVDTEIKAIDSKLSQPKTSIEQRVKQLEDLKIKEEIDGIKKDLSEVKNTTAASFLFNLITLGLLGGLGYFAFRKGNSSKTEPRNDKGRKSGSGSLGSANPQTPANQGYGNTHQGGKGLSGGRVMGRADNRSTRTSSRDFDEYPDENQNRYREGESDLDDQRQRDLKFRLNKPAQSQSDERGWGDRESNPNPVSSGDSPRQTYSPLAKSNRGLTEISAIQSYQAKSYSALEPFTVGYYSATSESVTRNRADWANPLDLIEFYDGLFWIVKAIERHLLFPNPRMRIEQTRIRGIEYFFETNFTDENYHSCTVDAPAYVELVNGKWVRIRKGRIIFLY